MHLLLLSLKKEKTMRLRKRPNRKHRRLAIEAKKLRIRILGNMCELCQSRKNIVGHHVRGKNRNRVYDIQLRCRVCESCLHKDSIVVNGNTEETMAILAHNNQIVHIYLRWSRNYS